MYCSPLNPCENTEQGQQGRNMAEDPEWEYVEPPPEVEFAMNTAETVTGELQEKDVRSLSF